MMSKIEYEQEVEDEVEKLVRDVEENLNFEEYVDKKEEEFLVDDKGGDGCGSLLVKYNFGLKFVEDFFVLIKEKEGQRKQDIVEYIMDELVKCLFEVGELVGKMGDDIKMLELSLQFVKFVIFFDVL